VYEWERVFGVKLAPVMTPPEEAERIKNKYMGPGPWRDFLRKFVWG
jgi:hypothetical protein